MSQEIYSSFPAALSSNVILCGDFIDYFYGHISYKLFAWVPFLFSNFFPGCFKNSIVDFLFMFLSFFCRYDFETAHAIQLAEEKGEFKVKVMPRVALAVGRKASVVQQSGRFGSWYAHMHAQVFVGQMAHHIIDLRAKPRALFQGSALVNERRFLPDAKIPI